VPRPEPPYARLVQTPPPAPPPVALPAAVERVVGWARSRPRRADLLLAGLLTLVLTPASLAALLGDRPPAGWLAVQLTLAVLAPAAVAARRWAPAASFALLSVSLAVSGLLPGLPDGQPFLPAAVVFPLGLYSYCAYGGPAATRAGPVVGVAGALLITGRALLDPFEGRRDTDTVLGSLLLLGFLLAVVAAAWSFAVFRTVRAVYLETLEERARLAEAGREDRARRAVRQERDRIARELHDVVAHSLSVIVTQAQGAAYVAATRPDQAARALDTIAETGRDALTDMRGLLGVLREEAPDTGEPPQPGLADLPGLLDRVRAAGLPVAYAETGSPAKVGAATGLAVYRLVQESLTNTLKHAGPHAAAAVRLDWGPHELAVEVRDDGRGPAPGGTGGRGLVGMGERVGLAGGTTASGPGPGGGFLVTATLPVGGGAR
jgi:signal transduction histidine kinase